MEIPIYCYKCGEESGYDREYARTLNGLIELRCQWCDKVVVPKNVITIQSYCGEFDYWLHKSKKGFLPSYGN